MKIKATSTHIYRDYKVGLPQWKLKEGEIYDSSYLPEFVLKNALRLNFAVVVLEVPTPGTDLEQKIVEPEAKSPKLKRRKKIIGKKEKQNDIIDSVE